MACEEKSPERFRIRAGGARAPRVGQALRWPRVRRHPIRYEVSGQKRLPPRTDAAPICPPTSVPGSVPPVRGPTKPPLSRVCAFRVPVPARRDDGREGSVVPTIWSETRPAADSLSGRLSDTVPTLAPHDLRLP